MKKEKEIKKEKLVCALCGSDELTFSGTTVYTTDNEEDFGDDFWFCQNCSQPSDFTTESEFKKDMNVMINKRDLAAELSSNRIAFLQVKGLVKEDELIETDIYNNTYYTPMAQELFWVFYKYYTELIHSHKS